jgi:hypothetical protein
MATIKVTAEGKVITKGGLPSCACCDDSSSGGSSGSSSGGSSSSSCGCDVYSISYFKKNGIYYKSGVDYAEVATVEPSPDTPPSAGWLRRDSCQRFVCLDIDEAGELVCSTVYGGPTTSGLDLVAILLTLLGSPITLPSGVHIYRFIFYGWYSDQRDPEDNYFRYIMAQPSDTKYDILKLIIP